MVAQIALIAYIFVAIGFFAYFPPTRAFILTYVVGILLLPSPLRDQGVIILTNSAQIEKYTACHLGALLGTLIFAPQAFARYRFDFLDAAFLLILAATFSTSMFGGLGFRDGVSNSLNVLRLWGPAILLAKIHITTFDDVYISLRTLIAGGMVYAVVAMLEFRLSPQFHRNLYGYFQHDFIQFARYDFFRPVGMLRHAIEMSFFLGSTAVAATWLWWKKLLPPYWGFLPGGAAVLILVAGLAATLTFSGYSAFILGMAVLALFHFQRKAWVLALIPVTVCTWMALRYTGMAEAGFLVDAAAFVDAARAQSLQYRFETEEIYLQLAHSSAFLGIGASSGLLVNRYGQLIKAVDAWWLITATYYGLAGLIAWLIVWTAPLVATLLAWRKLPDRFRDVAACVAVLIGLILVDFLFNSFPSYFLLILGVGMLSIWHRLAEGSNAPLQQPVTLPPVELEGARTLHAR